MHFEALRARHAGEDTCMRHIRVKHRAVVTTLDLCAHLCAAAPTARSAVMTTKNAQRRNVARTRAPTPLLSCLRRRGLSRSLPNLPPLLPPGESGERGLELPPLLPLLMESGERGLVMADMGVSVCVRGWGVPDETQRRSSTRYSASTRPARSPSTWPWRWPARRAPTMEKPGRRFIIRNHG